MVLFAYPLSYRGERQTVAFLYLGQYTPSNSCFLCYYFFFLKDGRSAVFYAGWKGHEEVLHELFVAGTDDVMGDKWGNRPIDFAPPLTRRRWETVKTMARASNYVFALHCVNLFDSMNHIEQGQDNDEGSKGGSGQVGVALHHSDAKQGVEKQRETLQSDGAMDMILKQCLLHVDHHSSFLYRVFNLLTGLE
jgi:hypothetical protein